MNPKDLITTTVYKLSLPKTVLDIFENKCTDELFLQYLRYDYNPPDCYYHDMPEDVLRQYRFDRYVPFMMTSFTHALAYDLVTKGYVRIDLEDFQEDALSVYTWDGLFLHEIIAWWEADWPDEDILGLASLFGLKHVQLILDWLNEHNGNDESSDNEQILLDLIGGHYMS